MSSIKDGWQYNPLVSLDNGLNKAIRQDLLDNGEATRAENVRFYAGEVVSCFGYNTLGNGFRGIAQEVKKANFSDGTSVVYMITTKGFYIYGNKQWVAVPDELTPTTLTSALPNSGSDIEIADATGYVTGGFIVVTLDSGDVKEFEITNVVGTVVTVDYTFTGELVAGIGNEVYRPSVLNGSTTIQVSSDIWDPSAAELFVNGFDKPKVYIGGLVRDIGGLDDIFGSSNELETARIVRVLYNQVCLFKTTEDGSYRAVRVRVSAIGNFDKWDGTTSEDGTFYDLLDGFSSVIAAEVLGPYLVLYRDGGITRMEYVGSEFRLWRFENVVKGDTAVSSKAVVEVSGVHVVFGVNNLFIYANGYNAQEYGDKVKNLIYGDGGLLAKSPEKIASSYVAYNYYLDELWFFVTTDTANFPNIVVKGNIAGDVPKWSTRLFNKEFVCGCAITLDDPILWSDLEDPWTSYLDTSWLKLLSSVGRPIIALLEDAESSVYGVNFVEKFDDGNSVTYTFETKIINSLQKPYRLDYMDMDLKGDACEIAVSVDNGATFETLTTIPASITYSRRRVFKQLVTKSLIVRFKTTGSDFGLKWLALNTKEQGEYNGTF